jgi:hypothetical protein
MARHEVEVDTALAELSGKLAGANMALRTAADSIHYQLGEKQTYLSKRIRVWPTTTEAAEAALKEKLSSGRVQGGYHTDYAAKTLHSLETARAAIVAIRAKMKPLEEEYVRVRWSRFFLVTNTGGHIHSSMRCSTCHLTTDFVWLPTLSGLKEADAVAAQGPRLCTVCFPSAPVEWTDRGAAKAIPADRCSGSGKPTRYEAGKNSRGGSSFCPECGKWVKATMYGTTPAHKRPKTK